MSGYNALLQNLMPIMTIQDYMRTLGQQACNQALASAWNDDVDEFAQGDQLADGGTVSGVDDLYRFGRQARGGK